MTTLTFPTNSIMAYVGADSGVVGVAGVTGLPYWPGDILVLMQTAALGSPGLRLFDIDPDGDETLQRTRAAIGVDEINTSTGGSACLTEDGLYVQFISHFANSCEFARVRTADFVLDAQFGIHSSSTAASGGTRILAPFTMLNGLEDNRLITTTQFNTQQVATIDTAFVACVSNGTLSTAGSTFGVLMGPGGTSGNDAYLMGIPGANGVSQWSAPIVLYSIAAGVLTSLGSIVPSDIDVTWTHFFRVGGLAWDEADGNLIIGVYNDDAVATQNYLVKINSANADVMWTRPITSLNVYTWSWTFARVNGTFHYLDSASLVRHINTLDGSQATETINGLSPAGPQFSDSISQSVIFFGTYSAVSPEPDYVGTYMGTDGHHTVSSQWMRYWFAYPDRRHLGMLGPVRVRA